MNQPHSRDKHTVSGSTNVGKGHQVNTGGPVGGGVRPGANGNRAGGSSQRGGMSAAGAVGAVALFMMLPKKLRRIVLVVLAVVVAISAVKTMMGNSASVGVIGGYDGPAAIYTTEPTSHPTPNSDVTMGYGSLADLFGAMYGDSSAYGGSYGSSSGSSSSSSGSTGYSSGSGSIDIGSLFGFSGSSSAAPVATPAPAAQSEEIDTSVSNNAREKRVTPLGGGKDTVTIMVYMCGTDLESKYGMGTSDLTEMTKANLTDKINLIVMTGGCRNWKNGVVSNSVNQIYRVRSGGLERLEDSFGNAAMTDPANLTKFIKYCDKNYPADRNMLILWDHGGGSISGYGYDEKQGTSNSMNLVKLSRALSDANCIFDWIGFDACLMGNLETALVCSDYADYLIASEEVEPGTGWYYTDWLNTLSRNTSTPTPTLAKELIDTYMSACRKGSYSSSSSQVTLSLVDLAEFEGTIPEVFRSFSKSLYKLIDSDDYKQVSEARAGARQFAASTRINQVDLVDLALRLGTKEGKALANAVQSCVKYNGSTISRSYGMSIYFPYETLNTVSNAVSTYSGLGMDSEYTKCIKSFASLGYGAQVSSSASQSQSYGSGSYTSYEDLLGQLFGSYTGSSSPSGYLNGNYSNSSGSQSSGYTINANDIFGLLNAFSGRSMPQNYEWVDTDFVADSAERIALNTIDPGRIYATEKNGRKVLSLTEEEWGLINTVELNIFVDDGEGYLDLGLDNVFEFDGTDLILGFDGTWITVDGKAAAYYLVSDVQNDDGSWTTTGRIPALLNGETVNLRVVFDDEHPYGAITGAYPIYIHDEADTVAKGDIELHDGDVIEFLCDYYGYDDSYSASYTLGSYFVYSGEPEIANMSINTDLVRVTYRLTDIYGNNYWIEA